MKKVVSGLMVGLMTSAFAMATFAAPTQEPVPKTPPVHTQKAMPKHDVKAADHHAGMKQEPRKIHNAQQHKDMKDHKAPMNKQEPKKPALPPKA